MSASAISMKYSDDQQDEIRKFERLCFLQLLSLQQDISNINQDSSYLYEQHDSDAGSVVPDIVSSDKNKDDKKDDSNLASSSKETSSYFANIAIKTDQLLKVILSKALLNPDRFYLVKKSENREEIIRNEAIKIIGDSLEDGITNILSEIFDRIGSLRSDKDEENLLKMLFLSKSQKNGAKKKNPLEAANLIELRGHLALYRSNIAALGMSEAYRNISGSAKGKSSFINNLYKTLSAIDSNAILGMSLKAYDNILGTSESISSFIGFLNRVLPTIAIRFEDSKYTKSQEDYRVSALDSIQNYLNKNLPETLLTDLAKLQNDGNVDSSFLKFLEKYVITCPEGKRNNNNNNKAVDFPYIVYWSLKDHNPLSDLYLRSIEPKSPDKDINATNLFIGTLNKEINSSNPEANAKQFEAYKTRLKETVLKPGGLDQVIADRVGVRIY